MKRLSASVYPRQRNATFSWLFRQTFRQAEPSQRVDCLARMEKKRLVFHQKIQRHIANWKMEPGVSSLSITNLSITTLCSNMLEID